MQRATSLVEALIDIEDNGLVSAARRESNV